MITKTNLKHYLTFKVRTHGHMIWEYESNGKRACINRNNNVLGDKHYCYPDNRGGEGCDTIWYSSLEKAREIIIQYLNGQIPSIPVKNN